MARLHLMILWIKTMNEQSFYESNMRHNALVYALNRNSNYAPAAKIIAEAELYANFILQPKPAVVLKLAKG
jgi:hypothetical protein